MRFISDFYNVVIVGKPRSRLGVPTIGGILEEPLKSLVRSFMGKCKIGGIEWLMESFIFMIIST